MAKFLTTIFILLFSLVSLTAGLRDYKIIVTTPGYTSVYQYDNENFAAGVAKELRVMSPVDIEESPCDIFPDRTLVLITVGDKEYNFAVSEEAPVVRLIYDRNRKTFTGAGFNYMENKTALYEAPSFNGTRIDGISKLFEREVERSITDKTLLDDEQPVVFLIEADIDENGMVQKVVELNGAIKQYARIIIDRFYDKAYMGWKPAQVNGVPRRSLAQFTFELRKESFLEGLKK